MSTLYKMSKAQWDANPKAFQQKLLEWRTMGMTKEQIDNIPPQHLSRLRRWQDIVEVSDKLARFYDGWSQRVSAESPLFKAGNLAELMQEIDENYGAEVSIDFRKAISHTQEANEVQPHTKAGRRKRRRRYEIMVAGADIARGSPRAAGLPVRHKAREHHPDLMINMTTADIGKMRLHREIMQLAKDCGLVEDSLHEGQKSANRSVADLLNDNPYISNDPEVQAEVIHEMDTRHLRRLYSDIDVPDDQLINPLAVREKLDALSNGDDDDDKGPGAKLMLFNENPETLYMNPLQAVRAVDAADFATLGANAPDLHPDELSARDNFLSALSSPVLRVKALESLWTGWALARSGAVYDDTDNKVPKDQSLAMADGTSESGLAITSVAIGGERADGLPAAESLHIIWNRKTDRILVVGEGKIAPDLKAAFNATRGTYVNKSENNATERVRTALGRLIDTERTKNEDLLKTAFRMRAAAPAPADDSKMDLKDLLVSRSVKPFLPVFITNRPDVPFYGNEP